MGDPAFDANRQDSDTPRCAECGQTDGAHLSLCPNWDPAIGEMAELSPWPGITTAAMIIGWMVGGWWHWVGFVVGFIAHVAWARTKAGSEFRARSGAVGGAVTGELAGVSGGVLIASVTGIGGLLAAVIIAIGGLAFGAAGRYIASRTTAGEARGMTYGGTAALTGVLLFGVVIGFAIVLKMKLPDIKIMTFGVVVMAAGLGATAGWIIGAASGVIMHVLETIAPIHPEPGANEID